MRNKDERRRTSAVDWAKSQAKGSSTSAIKLPEEFEFYKLEQGTHIVDFMLYRAGSHNKRADKGFEHFELEYGVHRIKKPDGTTGVFCCSWVCFEKPCYCCKWINDHGRTADPEVLKSLRVSTRHLWVINDKPGDKKNKLKVLDTGHYNRGSGFGEQIADAITARPDKYGNFADPVEGLKAQLTVKELTFPGVKYNGLTRLDFIERNYEYPESVIDKAPCLDDCLVETPAKTFQQLLDQEPEDEDEDEDEDTVEQNVDEDDDDQDEKSVKSRKKSEPEEDDDDSASSKGKKGKSDPTAKELGLKVGMLVMYRKNEYEIIKISGDGTSLTIEDEEGAQMRAIAPEDVMKVKGKEDMDEDEDNSDEDEKPVKGKKKPVVDDDDEEEDEEEESEEDDSDDEEDEGEDEDDEGETPPKKRGRPTKR